MKVYHIDELLNASISDQQYFINEMARGRWRLVSVIQLDAVTRFFFEREAA